METAISISYERIRICYLHRNVLQANSTSPSGISPLLLFSITMTPLGDYLPRKYVYILMHAQLGTRTHLTRTSSAVFSPSTSLATSKSSVLPTFPSFPNFRASSIYFKRHFAAFVFLFFFSLNFECFNFQQIITISDFNSVVHLKHKITMKYSLFLLSF